MKKIKLSIIILAVVLLVAAIVALLRLNRNNHLSFGTDSEIDVTPTQIVSIKAIGEWEFLSVSAEELVDTVRKGLFSNDELARIYFGTLRLGIDMRQVTPGWITASGDSVVVELPKVGLLDKEFIDETRTKAFYESGRWTARDREALYRKARRQMMSHALTKENLKTAEANAEHEVRRMLSAMGYNNITVKFDK